jgi:hypothetical protein
VCCVCMWGAAGRVSGRDRLARAADRSGSSSSGSHSRWHRVVCCNPLPPAGCQQARTVWIIQPLLRLEAAHAWSCIPELLRSPRGGGLLLGLRLSRPRRAPAQRIQEAHGGGVV